jgi:hypothetical protein
MDHRMNVANFSFLSSPLPIAIARQKSTKNHKEIPLLHASSITFFLFNKTTLIEIIISAAARITK